ncbi:MAG TPA: ribose 5-phosphate isomerase B [Candidatus Binatia bacterium]
MIVIGSDHGGLELKNFLVDRLLARGLAVVDMGTQTESAVDYPDFGRLVSLEVARGGAERGILICTSGIGMSILANKFAGVRAALVHDLESAQMSREHNDSNILVLGGRKTERPMAEAILDRWLQTPFAGGRHQRRLDKITRVEQELGTRVDCRAKG